MKVTKLMLSLFATALLSLVPWSAQRAAAQSKQVQVNPLIAKFGHENRSMIPSSNAAIVTESGPVKGFQFAGDEQAAKNEEVFLGIPYAAPPIRNLRWLPPHPHAKFQGIFQANTYGNFWCAGQSLGKGNGMT